MWLLSKDSGNGSICRAGWKEFHSRFYGAYMDVCKRSIWLGTRQDPSYHLPLHGLGYIIKGLKVISLSARITTSTKGNTNQVPSVLFESSKGQLNMTFIITGSSRLFSIS